MTGRVEADEEAEKLYKKLRNSSTSLDVAHGDGYGRGLLDKGKWANTATGEVEERKRQIGWRLMRRQ